MGLITDVEQLAPSPSASEDLPETLDAPGLAGAGSEVSPTEEQISAVRAGLIASLAHTKEDAKLVRAKVDKLICKKFKKHCKKGKKLKGKAVPALHDPIAAAAAVTPEAAAAPLYNSVVASAVRSALSPLAEGVAMDLHYVREDLSVPEGTNALPVTPLQDPVGTLNNVASRIARKPISRITPITSAPTRFVSLSPEAAPEERGAPAIRATGLTVLKEMHTAHAPASKSGRKPCCKQ